MMSSFLIKVTLLFGCLVSGAYAKDYNIETTEDHILIYSSIDTVKYTEISEIYPLDPILNQIVKLNKTLSLIQGLLRFSIENRDCTTLGNVNSNIDNIEELIKIAKTKNLTMLRMQISETGIKHKFVGYVVNENHQTSCLLTNSVANIQYLLAQNTIRNTPETDQQIINYRDNMLLRFKDNYKRSCIRQGSFPSRFVKSKFVVSQPQIENCAAICYFMLSNFLNAVRHNSVSSIKQNLTNCQSWSYNVKTGFCELIEKISTEDFIGEIDWEKDDNLYAMTGLATCQPSEFSRSMPRVYANDRLTNMHEICRFSSENASLGIILSKGEMYVYIRL